MVVSATHGIARVDSRKHGKNLLLDLFMVASGPIGAEKTEC